MLKKYTLCFTLVLMLISLHSTTLLAQGSSPFLITGKLPHLTKLLMQQWENPRLNLSAEQQTKLLVIRTETISGVRVLGPQVIALEKQVVEGINQGKTPEELQATVTKLADLKASATMLHLQCIYKTNAILSQEQLTLLTSTTN